MTIFNGGPEDNAFPLTIFDLVSPASQTALDGGGGTDTLIAASIPVGLFMNVETGVLAINDTRAQFGTFENFEVIQGTSFVDFIFGPTASGPVSLFGGAGSDRIFLGDRPLNADDVYNGGIGTDWLVLTGISANISFDGLLSQVTIDGTTAQAVDFEIVSGGSGDDVFRVGDNAMRQAQGRDGNDTVIVADFDIGEGYVLTGDSGTDMLDMSAQSLSYTFDLGEGWMQGFTGAGRATILDFEQVRAGGGNDFIVGSNVGTAVQIIDSGDGLDRIVTNTSFLATGSIFDGGGGDQDELRLESLNEGIRLNLQTGQLVMPVFGSTSSVLNIESFRMTGFNDVVGGSQGDDVVILGDGRDLFVGNAGNDTSFAGDGNDTLRGGTGADRLGGDDGNDFVDGGAGADTLTGNNGQDTVVGGDGNDYLQGGSGNDGLAGNAGNDTLFGEGDDDRLFGQGGFDSLNGGTGNDRLDGGSHADNLFGDEGNDTLIGGQGLDRLFGGDGNDIGYGGIDNDAMFGDNGDDTMNGQDGNDRIFGGFNNDLLSGDAGNDTLFGGAGFDTLVGSVGNDRLSGNFNADRFIFADAGGGFGRDTITDFAATNDFEVIDLSRVASITNMFDLLTNHATQVGTSVLIDAGGGNSIELLNVDLSDLDQNDFVF